MKTSTSVDEGNEEKGVLIEMDKNDDEFVNY